MKQLLLTLFRLPTKNLFVQIFRYCFAGGIAFIVDFGLCYLFTGKFGLHYTISAVIGAIGGTTVSYTTNVLWVFHRRNVSSRIKEITIFISISAIGLAFTPLLMWIFTDKMGFYYLVSKVFVTIIIVIWNFIAKKIILFK